MAIFTTSGAKVSIGAALPSKATDFVAADFTSQTWVLIGNTESIGSFGDQSESVTFNDIGRSRTLKLKGSRDAGDLELVCGLNWEDAGQAALVAAEKTIFDFAFKVEFNDAPAGASPKNSIRYFVGKVMSASESLEESDNVAKLNTTISINSNIVKIAASAT